MITYRTDEYDFNQALDLIENVTAEDLGKELPSRRYAEVSAADYSRRYARLVTLMKADGIDAAFVTQEENVRYFTGYLSVLWISNFRPLVGILPTDVTVDSSVFVSGQELGNAKATAWVEDPRSFSPQVPPVPGMAQLITDKVGQKGRVAIELGFGQRMGMNMEQFAQLQELLPGIEFVDLAPLSETVRMLKSDEEIAFIREACRISCEGTQRGWEAIREGMTERELLTIIGTGMFAEGAEVGTTKASFMAIMAGDDRAPLSNAVASDRVTIKPGDFITIDGGANYRGYTTDYIRQAALGSITPEQKKWMDVAIESNHRAIASVKPGVLASDVYDAAMAVLEEHGLLEHSKMTIVGHGIGADVHELPWLGEAGTVYTSGTTLREGMVLSIEPAIKAPDDGPKGHFIVENMVVITKDGTEPLTDILSDEVWIQPVQ